MRFVSTVCFVKSDFNLLVNSYIVAKVRIKIKNEKLKVKNYAVLC